MSFVFLFLHFFAGVITTKTRIDYESIKQIYVSAFVTDTGVPQLTSTAEITVDIMNTNDNDPAFSMPEYRFTIAENSPRGTYVGKVDAKDNDDGKFTFDSVGKCASNTFFYENSLSIREIHFSALRELIKIFESFLKHFVHKLVPVMFDK